MDCSPKLPIFAPMKHPYFDFDLIRFSDQDGAAGLDKQFVVIDNLEEREDENKSSQYFVNYPVKLSFTIAIFCVAGSIRFRINLQECELRANDLLVVMEGNIGEFVGMSSDARMAVIAYGGEYFNGTTHIQETMMLEKRLHTSPLCHLSVKAMEESLAIYRLVKSKISEDDNPFRSGALMGYAQVLTNNAYYYLNEKQKAESEESDSPSGSKGRQYELYTQFMSELQKHYTHERSIKYYADLLCVTPKYLSQVIRNVSGRLAGKWITDFVILEAKALLKGGKLTIQQIADNLNFANQSFFGRWFKDNVGMSPSEYRNQK